jgi:hypothetical protein
MTEHVKQRFLQFLMIRLDAVQANHFQHLDGESAKVNLAEKLLHDRAPAIPMPGAWATSGIAVSSCILRLSNAGKRKAAMVEIAHPHRRLADTPRQPQPSSLVVECGGLHNSREGPGTIQRRLVRSW